MGGSHVAALHKQRGTGEISQSHERTRYHRRSRGYPAKIFEVNQRLIDKLQEYAVIVRHTIPSTTFVQALKAARRRAQPKGRRHVFN